MTIRTTTYTVDDEGDLYLAKHGSQVTIGADQPTVEQVKAAALREAAADWSDWDGLSAPEDWLRARADRIEAGR